MRITARLIIRYNSARGRNWRRRAHRVNVTNRHKTKTVEKFGKDSPTVFIYRFSGIPASSYPRLSIRRSSENVSKSIECSNARSMDTRQSLKAFYASIRYGVPVVHSSLQHCKLYVFIRLTAQNYGFSWGPANFFRAEIYLFDSFTNFIKWILIINCWPYKSHHIIYVLLKQKLLYFYYKQQDISKKVTHRVLIFHF